MLVVSGSHHPLFGQSSLLMFGAVLLVDARGKKGCAHGCAGGDVEEREKCYGGGWLQWLPVVSVAVRLTVDTVDDCGCFRIEFNFHLQGF